MDFFHRMYKMIIDLAEEFGVEITNARKVARSFADTAEEIKKKRPDVSDEEIINKFKELLEKKFKEKYKEKKEGGLEMKFEKYKERLEKIVLEEQNEKETLVGIIEDNNYTFVLAQKDNYYFGFLIYPSGNFVGVKFDPEGGKPIELTEDEDRDFYDFLKEKVGDKIREISYFEKNEPLTEEEERLISEYATVLEKKLKNIRDLPEWKPPKTRGERRKMYEKNKNCFLYVEKSITGKIEPKYPVCPRGSTTPSCEGAIAALRRAIMVADNPDIDDDERKVAVVVAKKAYKLAKKICPKEVDVPDLPKNLGVAKKGKK